MSASTHGKFNQKHGSRLLLETEGYELRIRTRISGAERVGRFQERHKVATERSIDTPTSRATLPLLYLSPSNICFVQNFYYEFSLVFISIFKKRLADVDVSR
ncbi:hypothetical protein EVAR_16308_1 [Eumeta japonica]|uniref:Uncharacterized protein n=1 Tax=Eumeta variegata TaxID=151549 RepID=A0A4C1VFJ3_EUMVA|nr:hypothetical protein EVAR_16308_1 [Eumeta japonica]